MVEKTMDAYGYCYQNPVRFVDPTGMEAIDNDDIYIDSITGKELGRDGAKTNNYRLIDSTTFNYIKDSNGGTTSETATQALQDSSTALSIDDTKIQQTMQDINDKSRSNEQVGYIVLDSEKSKITTIMGEAGKDGQVENKLSSRTIDGVEIITKDGYLVLGQIHGHNKRKGFYPSNGIGMSGHDTTMAKDLNINVYAIEAFNTDVGGRAYISRSSPDGTTTTHIGQTRGYPGTTEGTFNVGLDSFQNWISVKKN